MRRLSFHAFDPCVNDLIRNCEQLSEYVIELGGGLMVIAARSIRHTAAARVAFGAVIAAVALLAAACIGGSGEPSHPDECDPRISDLVDLVERERDLQFLHPVYVEFLSEEEYQARAGEYEELSEELAELESVAGIYRAMGSSRRTSTLLRCSRSSSGADRSGITTSRKSGS